MKSIFTTILLCLFSILTIAQQGINYQAVARDSNGDEITNTSLSVKFSILEGDSATSSSLSWQEIHSVTTNDFGLFVAKIGKGTSTSLGSSSNFSSINWGDTTHSLMVEIDYGNGYINMGTTQFMSVPYALYGEDADSDPANEIQSLTVSGDTIFISNGNYVVIPGLSFVNNLIVNGCMDSSACNYNANANTDDGSCLTNYGCTDVLACNYDSLATCDDGSCVAANPSPYLENFDGGSTNIAVMTNNGWTSISGSTPSVGTGPTADVSGSGNYYYHETSYGYNPTVSLSISCIDISSLSNPMFSFHYHMYGSDMGALDVKVNGSSVWTKSGDQGNSWKLAVIPLTGYTGNIEIEFVSTHNGSYQGDKAIDEIRVSDDVYGCTDANAFNYNSSATIDDGSCIAVVNGCTDSTAFNFNSTANTDDGSCCFVSGCTNSGSSNYDPNACYDDGSCIPCVYGCTDPTAFNYNSAATCDDGSCVAVLNGCTDPNAFNYNSAANTDDGSCVQPTTVFTHTGSAQYFVVPAGVTSITVEVIGGAGGMPGWGINHPRSAGYQSYGYSTPWANVSDASRGGKGGRVTAGIYNPSSLIGDTLQINVGGEGAWGGTSSSSHNVGSNAYGGGGRGYDAIAYQAGGGASDIRVGAFGVNDRIIVAGGGGSSSMKESSGWYTFIPGGAGGGLTGGTGTQGYNGAYLGGLGGSQTAGGLGGSAGYSSVRPYGGDNRFNGDYTGVGNGGNGDMDPYPYLNPGMPNRGAGGGGGYHGGGSGFTGGGGSSYTDPTYFTNVTHTQGYWPNPSHTPFWTSSIGTQYSSSNSHGLIIITLQ